MQHVLQAGLAAGMSAVSGFHSNKPPPVPKDFDGMAAVLPQDIVPTGETRVTFKGKNSDAYASPISIGAWPWGDKATFHWSEDELPAVHEAWKVIVSSGVNFIDTAQAYGSGRSEEICGELYRASGLRRDQFFIQTKWYVVPDLQNIIHPVDAPAKKLEKSLQRMGLEYVDCYLVHGHIHPQSIAKAAKGLAECVDKGLTKTVGVANYSSEDMVKMQEELQKYGIPLATNQCEYSILRRYPETSGLLQTCKERGIIFQSYSSLAQGRLSGKYNSQHEPPDTYRFSKYPMKYIEPTLKVLEDIGKKRRKSIAAVALNYNLSKGVLPVVGVRKPQQAEQNMEALGWRLSDDEIRQIDEFSYEGKKTVLWQQG